MSETKTTRLPSAIAERLNGMSVEQRAALIARALSAPVEPPVEAASVVAETKAQVALPEPGERAAGVPVAGSPSVHVKTFWSTGRSGLGESVEWAGAVVHLPEDCRWFLSLDDASRADAVRRALSRCREAAVECEERLAGMSVPEGVERPAHMPQSWEPVTVWVPSKEACYPVRIQELVERGLGIEKRPGSFDLEAFIAEKKAKAAEKLGAAS